MQRNAYSGKHPFSCAPSMDHSPKAQAKRRLGLDPDALHLLVLCGDGEPAFYSDLISMVYVCDDHDSAISVVCGENSSLAGRLQEELGHLETIHIHICDSSFELSVLLESADLLLTPLHEIAASEAKKRRLPVVFMQKDGKMVPPRCRELLEKGCAAVGQEDVALAEYCIELLDQTQRREQMESAYHNLGAS